MYFILSLQVVLKSTQLFFNPNRQVDYPRCIYCQPTIGVNDNHVGYLQYYTLVIKFRDHLTTYGLAPTPK